MMTQLEKLVEKLYNESSANSFTKEEIQRILESYGYAMIRCKGSHVKFKLKGKPTIVFAEPRSGKKNLSAAAVNEIRKKLKEAFPDEK